MQLTNENYYSKEANEEYLSVSQKRLQGIVAKMWERRLNDETD